MIVVTKCRPKYGKPVSVNQNTCCNLQITLHRSQNLRNPVVQVHTLKKVSQLPPSWRVSFTGVCANVKCRQHAHCEVKDGKAQCVCKDARQCPQTYVPVCGHDNNTYINSCYLDVANCLLNDSVTNQTPGICGMSLRWLFRITFSNCNQAIQFLVWQGVGWVSAE